jgi:hypothetical protein
MRQTRFIGLLIVALALLCMAPAYAQAGVGAAYFSTSAVGPLAAWRWLDDALTWLRNIGMDRGRLVQVWLLFMLIGLYIIMRIKPRA